MVLYREYPPCPALAPYVACLWTCHMVPERPVQAHRVLPDNCIDILWQDLDQPGKVAGMMSCARQVLAALPVRTIGVRFKPGAATYFFKLPLHELQDLHPALPQLWGDADAERFASALWERPLTIRQALASVQRLLLVRLRRHGAALHPGLAEAAIGAIEAAQGTLRIDVLARSLGVSRQHLAQQFKARVGLGAKQFARVCRFRHASERLRHCRPGQTDWAELAIELGYYDQAHLIHEFQALSGSTPASFAR
jgi:AraC-like DNA-binding protein